MGRSANDLPDDDGRVIDAAWQRIRAAWSSDFPLPRWVWSAYAGPGRHYHNLHHVAECLRDLEAFAAFARNASAAATALIFHDVVYDPTRPDNEQESARLALEFLARIGVPQADRRAVEECILATRHQGPAGGADAQLVADIDLAILGKPAAVFDEYERAVRLEYAHVPDAAFAAGRARILRQLLARQSIYLTPALHDRYEAPARANLARSLARLEVAD